MNYVLTLSFPIILSSLKTLISILSFKNVTSNQNELRRIQVLKDFITRDSSGFTSIEHNLTELNALLAGKVHLNSKRKPCSLTELFSKYPLNQYGNVYGIARIAHNQRTYVSKKSINELESLVHTKLETSLLQIEELMRYGVNPVEYHDQARGLRNILQAVQSMHLGHYYMNRRAQLERIEQVLKDRYSPT
ncbi:MAG: hypothetical protein Altm2KO_12730 [Alteromonas macleodii]|jgi:hypothetical protein